jgi:hypothetical protein
VVVVGVAVVGVVVIVAVGGEVVVVKERAGPGVKRRQEHARSRSWAMASY